MLFFNMFERKCCVKPNQEESFCFNPRFLPFVIDFETQYEIEDYTKVDTIIHQMRLTVAEEETLNYYMAGLGFVAIAQMQNVNNTTVWRRRKSIQKKYLRYVVMQG